MKLTAEFKHCGAMPLLPHTSSRRGSQLIKYMRTLPFYVLPGAKREGCIKAGISENKIPRAPEVPREENVYIDLMH